MNTLRGHKKIEIERTISAQFRGIVKSEGYSLSSGYLFKRQGDFFLDAPVLVQKSKVQLCLHVTYNIKTLQEDELFWELMEMNSNSECPLSFRAKGAFVMPSFQLGKKVFPIDDNCDLELLCKAVISEFNLLADTFLSSIQNNEEQFYRFVLSQENMYLCNLQKMIAHILLGNYSEAFQLVNEELANGQRGGFQNNGQDIYFFIHNYCKNKLVFNEL